MTSPYVTFPQPPAPRPSAWPVFRALLSVAAVLLATFAALIAGAIAIITWSGCFIACTGENHAAGGALGLLAVALLAAGPGAVAGLYRSKAWLTVAECTAGVGAVLMLMALGAN